MRKILIALAPVVVLATAAPSLAHDRTRNTVTGAGAGAITGAIVGGPVGAAVGGVAGAIAGTALSPPPAEVEAYVIEQDVPPIVIEGEIAVGRPLPGEVVLYPVPEDPAYAYAFVNERYVIVDPRTRVIVDFAG